MAAAVSAVSIASVPIPVTNSAKDTEIALAKLLKDQLQLNSSLKLVDGDPDNLRLLVTFRTDEKQGMPRVSTVIDTAVVARDRDGNAVSQSIYIVATADIIVRKDLAPKLLQCPAPGTPACCPSGSSFPAAGSLPEPSFWARSMNRQPRTKC